MSNDAGGFAGIINRIERELAVVESRAQELRSALKVIHELTGQAEYAPSSATIDPAHKPDVSTATAHRPAVSLRKKGLSLHDAAEIVLRQAGEHLKAREIAERMLEGGYPYSKDLITMRSSIAGTLDRKAREGDTFTKPAKGLYGLLEWGGREPAAQSSTNRTLFESDSAEGAEHPRPNQDHMRATVDPGLANSTGGPNLREGSLGNGKSSDSNPNLPALITPATHR